MTVAFPKPKDVQVKVYDVRTYSGGREVCSKFAVGRTEYRRRMLEMLKRQGGRCCLEMYAPMCPGRLSEEEATFEHERGRCGGKRDDRIALPDGTWINGAAHALCNEWKGSRYIDYNRSFRVYEGGA